MPTQPDSFLANEQAGRMVPAYCYILEHRADGTRSFVTNWERDVKISNLPARFAAADPQTFNRLPVAHSANNINAEFASKTIELTISTQDEKMRRYFATASAVKIAVYIIRVNSEQLLDPDAVIDFNRYAILVNSGVIGSITMKGQQIQATMTPEPHLTDVTVPRYYFQRTCNHVLYGPACKVVRDSFKVTGHITAVDHATRTLTIDAQGPNADFLRNGFLIHEPTGQQIGINTITHVTTTSVMIMRFWLPNFTVGDFVTCFAGCRHTTDDCRSKFTNIENFGGFPYVPNVNPTINGVA